MTKGSDKLPGRLHAAAFQVDGGDQRLKGVCQGWMDRYSPIISSPLPSRMAEPRSGFLAAKPHRIFHRLEPPAAWSNPPPPVFLEF